MSTANETILCYFPDPVLGAKAKKIFLAQKIRIKTVAPEQMGQTVGALMGLKDSPAAPAAAPGAPSEPVLVLTGFTSARMNQLFAALRRSGIPPIGLKAVLTPTNAAWSFRALCDELTRERSVLQGQ